MAGSFLRGAIRKQLTHKLPAAFIGWRALDPNTYTCKEINPNSKRFEEHLYDIENAVNDVAVQVGKALRCHTVSWPYLA